MKLQRVAAALVLVAMAGFAPKYKAVVAADSWLSNYTSSAGAHIAFALANSIVLGAVTAEAGPAGAAFTYW